MILGLLGFYFRYCPIFVHRFNARGHMSRVTAYRTPPSKSPSSYSCARVRLRDSDGDRSPCMLYCMLFLIPICPRRYSPRRSGVGFAEGSYDRARSRSPDFPESEAPNPNIPLRPSNPAANKVVWLLNSSYCEPCPWLYRTMTGRIHLIGCIAGSIRVIFFP